MGGKAGVVGMSLWLLPGERARSRALVAVSRCSHGLDSRQHPRPSLGLEVLCCLLPRKRHPRMVMLA